MSASPRAPKDRGGHEIPVRTDEEGVPDSETAQIHTLVQPVSPLSDLLEDLCIAL